MTLLDEPTATTTAAEPPAPPSSSASRRLGLWAVLVGVALAVLALFVVRPLLRAVPHFYTGTVLQGDDPAPALDGLVHGDGTPVDLADHAGKIVVLYFGYTACPDICPTTMLVARDARAALSAEQAADVDVIMISIDPERDDPETIDNYAAAFDSSFRGASGALADVEPVAVQYGIAFRQNEPDADGNYFVDHTTTLIGIDREGSVRIVWGPDATPEDIADDLDALLDL